MLSLIYLRDIKYWPNFEVDYGVKVEEFIARYPQKLDENKVFLGKLLFNKKSLGLNKSVSCHVESLGFSDGAT